METQTKTFKKYFTCHQTLLCMHQLLIKGKIYLHNRIYNLLQSHDVTYTLMNAISIGSRMNASAFRDLWARVMF